MKYKERLSKLKAKCIDIDLEISKKNTENDLLKLEKNEMLKRISKLEISLNDKNKQISTITYETEDFQISNENNLKSDLSEYLNAEGNLVFEKNKNESDEGNKIKLMKDEIEEELEYIKGENIILLEKCKNISNENENNKGLIGKMENILKNLQKEKNDLSDEINALLTKESASQSNVNVDNSVFLYIL